MRELTKRQRVIEFFNDRFFLLPASSALLLGLSRYPLKLNFLVFIAFLPLLCFWQQDKHYSWRRVIKAAVSFSSVYTLVTLYWISVVTLPGFFGLFILFGFYYSLLFLLISRINRALPRLKYLGIVFSLLTFEWIQNYGQLRFPWFNIGYSIAEYTSLIQIAEFGGIYLLSLSILIINLLIFSAIRFFPQKRSLFLLALVFILLLTWSLWGRYRINNLPLQEKDFTAAIVQVSIPQDIKWDNDFYEATLDLYREYTLQAAFGEPDLIIFPESAIPDYVLQRERPGNFLKELVREIQIPIFFGFPHYEYDQTNENNPFKYFNSTTLIDLDEEFREPYHKIFLVPVGERIPFMEYIPLLGELELGQANWEYGEKPVHFSLTRPDSEFLFSSIICFEVAFPHLNAQLARDEVDFLVNVTNDAWFKRTIGPYQHAMMTLIRAVETRTQIYRAANTGISLIVNPKGEVLKKTALFEQTTIAEKLYVYDGLSRYVKEYSRYSFIFFIVTLILFFWTILSSFSLKRPD